MVTFLGKGGVGKTTSAVLLAKYFSLTGRKTCLVVQSPEDKTADELLGTALSSKPALLDGGNLTAIRLETTKTLSAAMEFIKKVDTRVGFSQGILDEVSGDELSVLPGLDSILAIAVLERLAKPAGGLLSSVESQAFQEDFDFVVFDGSSNTEVLRMFGSPEKTRWYLRRFRSLAEKTDVGRVSLPTIARFVESLISSNSSPNRADRTTAEVWEAVDHVLTRAADAFSDPKRFSAYLVTVPDSQSATSTSLRLWGSAMQAGMNVSGAFVSPLSSKPFGEAERFSPLDTVTLPQMSGDASSLDWGSLVESMKEVAENLLEGRGSGSIPKPVSVNTEEGTVSIFLPGFDKSEVKLSQWKGGSELLVEAGDQRRSIAVPRSMRGKVVGAKFVDKYLLVALKKSPSS